MTRLRLPDRRASIVFAFECNDLRYAASASWFDDGRLGEVFVGNYRADTHADACAKDAAILASIALQFGAPLEVLRKGCCAPRRVARRRRSARRSIFWRRHDRATAPPPPTDRVCRQAAQPPAGSRQRPQPPVDFEAAIARLSAALRQHNRGARPMIEFAHSR